jgi:hypothetical protein
MTDRTNEYMREYWKNHPEQVIKQRERCRKYSRSRVQEDSKRSQELRTKILKILGTKCSNSNCPISPEKMDVRLLEIDHVNGGGYKERKSFRQGYFARSRYYQYILSQLQSGSEEYQLLCVYCNRLKMLETKQFRKNCLLK